jgi:hypothetical protein
MDKRREQLVEIMNSTERLDQWTWGIDEREQTFQRLVDIRKLEEAASYFKKLLSDCRSECN